MRWARCWPYPEEAAKQPSRRMEANSKLVALRISTVIEDIDLAEEHFVSLPISSSPVEMRRRPIATRNQVADRCTDCAHERFERLGARPAGCGHHGERPRHPRPDGFRFEAFPVDLVLECTLAENAEAEAFAQARSDQRRIVDFHHDVDGQVRRECALLDDAARRV